MSRNLNSPKNAAGCPRMAGPETAAVAAQSSFKSICNSVERICNSNPVPAWAHGGRILLFSNKEPVMVPEEDGLPIIGLSNTFEVIQGKYLLVPYGEETVKKRGHTYLQRFNKAAADEMVKLFNSVRGKFTRQFAGLPFYIGHPDDPEFANQDTDKKSYGWTGDLLAGPDALQLEVKWSDAATDIISNGLYKFFSPSWLARETGEKSNGVPIVQPYWLRSCGFTNSPNWPVYPLSNQTLTQQQEEGKMLQRLIAILGLDGGTEDDVVSVIAKLVEAAKKIQEMVDAKWAAQSAAQDALPNEMPLEERVVKVIGLVDEVGIALANEIKIKETGAQAVVDAETAKATAETAFADERKERIVLLVNEAIVGGKVLEADKEKWIVALGENFTEKSEELSNAIKLLKIDPETNDLGQRNSKVHETKQAKILSLVNAKLTERGWGQERYHDVFMEVKGGNPELFTDETKGEDGK